MIRQLGLGVLLVGLCTSTSWGVMTHQYTFNDGTFNDVIGGAPFVGTPYNGATAAGGQLQLSPNPFTPAGGPYLSLPTTILPTTGSVTIEQWFTFIGSGFFTEAWTFTDHASDNVNPPTNPPDADSGQYFMHTISNPQGGPVPSGGGSSIAQSLAGFGGGAETRAYGTTPGIGAGGGGYLDNGQTFMAATVIDGTAGTLSYYVFRASDGVGGLQQTIPAIPLSSYTFTNAYLGRSPFPPDNSTSGSVDEFRIYDEARTTAQIQADFVAGPVVGGPSLTIDRTTGSIAFSNNGVPIKIFSYTLNSNSGSFNTAAIQPISMRLDSAANGGNGSFDNNDAWDVVGTSTANTVSEADRLGEGAEDGGTVGSVTLSTSNGWYKSFRQDVTATAQIFNGTNYVNITIPVQYTGNGGNAYKRSDLNFDNLINGTDWNTFKANHLTTLNPALTDAQTSALGDLDGDADVDVVDFRTFKNDFIAANGAAAWAALGASVPEPGSLALLAAGVSLAFGARRRRR